MNSRSAKVEKKIEFESQPTKEVLYKILNEGVQSLIVIVHLQLPKCDVISSCEE